MMVSVVMNTTAPQLQMRKTSLTNQGFAGFNVEEFFDEIVGAVDVEAHTVFKISSCCHKRYMSAFLCCLWLLRAQNYKISAECPSFSLRNCLEVLPQFLITCLRLIQCIHQVIVVILLAVLACAYIVLRASDSYCDS